MASITELVKKLDNADQVQNYQARLAISRLEIAAGAVDQAADRKALAAELALAISGAKEVADPKKPKEKPKSVALLPAKVRNTLIRNLAGVATEAEVSTLADALDDFEVREMARWALDRIAVQGAADALAAAATKAVGSEFRVGVLNSLGRKATASNVVAALKECIQDTDREVRLAAAEALANHADPAHDALIVAAKQEGGGRRATKRMADARLRLAAGLTSAGQKDAAKKIYSAVAADKVEEAQKKAAQAALEKLA